MNVMSKALTQSKAVPVLFICAYKATRQFRGLFPCISSSWISIRWLEFVFMDILAVVKFSAFGFYICHNSRVMTNKKRLKMAAAGFHMRLTYKARYRRPSLRKLRASLDMERWYWNRKRCDRTPSFLKGTFLIK